MREIITNITKFSSLVTYVSNVFKMLQILLTRISLYIIRYNVKIITNIDEYLFFVTYTLAFLKCHIYP